MPKTKKSASKAKLEWLPQKTFELEFTIPWNKVKTSYDQVVREVAKTADIKGFRKGKAPLGVVEKSIDKSTLYGEVINQLLPESYAKAVAQHNLKPAIAPKVQIVEANEGKPWTFKAKSCELPEVKLRDYQKTVKGALAKDKIWTPDKGDPAKSTTPDQKDKDLTQTQKLNLITQALIKDIPLELPDLLVESERDRLLAKLLDQVQKLGLTIEQYAASNQKTVDQVRKEYNLTAVNTLKLELILQAIAKDKNFKADDKDIDKMIEASGDEKIKKQLKTPSQRAYIATILVKRQAIDYLLSL